MQRNFNLYAEERMDERVRNNELKSVVTGGLSCHLPITKLISDFCNYDVASLYDWRTNDKKNLNRKCRPH